MHPICRDFIAKATIHPFHSSHTVKPCKKSSYNDDVRIPHYTSSSRTYADRQRKGLQEEHTDSLSLTEHVNEALSAPFFLGLPTPLPESVESALNFIKASPSDTILDFWETQLKHTNKLVEDSKTIESEWVKLIPAELKLASGKLKLAPLMSLLYQQNMGGSHWLQQFLFGFPLVGTISQKHTFPSSDKLKTKKPIDLTQLTSSNARRFTDRAAKSGYKNSLPLWEEAITQHQKGWLTKPFLLAEGNTPFTLKDKKLNIAFRFGVEQADKLRACDDLCHSMTNLACVVQTPIKLASWDHVAEMCRLVASTACDWHFFKADHEAAYKQLPLNWEHSRLAVIALRSPTDGRWYGFMSRTLMFGAVAAVIHYNVFSRIISELMCRLFGIPMLSYFDDFGGLLPAKLARQGLSTFSRWCEILGISLKLEKSEVGANITFLGLKGSFPS